MADISGVLTGVCILATGLRRVVRAFAVYGAVACLTVSAFVVSHYFGNRISFELALERFAEEFAAEARVWGVRRLGFYNPYGYCFVSGAVLAGASPEDRHPLRDAILPKAIDSGDETAWCRQFAVRYNGDPQTYVPIQKTEAEIAASGSTGWQRFLPYRYWWGSKAIFGIALGYMSVVRYHEWVRTACYVAYALLAIAVLLLGWRALVVASPVLLFGVGLSAIDYFPDLVNGLPYLWAVFAPVLLALILRREAGSRAVRVFCFFAGMVQAYLWLLEGNNFIATALVGLVVWLGSGRQPPFARLARSMFAVLMHVVGFVASLAIGLLTKAVTMGLVTKNLANANSVVEKSFAVILHRVGRVLSPEERDLVGRELGAWIELLPVGLPTIELLLWFSVLALLASVVVAVIHACRGNTEALAGVLLMAGLLVGVCIHFVVPSDVSHRTARVMWLPPALCCSCLLFVLVRVPPPAWHALALVATSVVAVFSYDLWRHVRTHTALRALTDADRIISDKFDVYHKGRHLFYVNERCSGADMRRRFMLDIYPVRGEDLELQDRQRGFELRHFYFASFRLFSFDASCQAIVELPAYKISRIRTGQYPSYDGHWDVTAPASGYANKQSLGP